MTIARTKCANIMRGACATFVIAIGLKTSRRWFAATPRKLIILGVFVIHVGINKRRTRMAFDEIHNL